MFGLVEHHAAGRVEGMQPSGGEVLGELRDARLVGDRGERVGSAGRRFGRVLAARAVHLVELLGLACSRAPSARRRSATRARCRRDGAARRSPRRAAGTARPRRAWWHRPRSSAPAAGTACRRRRTRCPARCSGSSTKTSAAEPVLRLAGQPVAALEQQDALAGRRQPVGERAAARAAADDDHVVGSIS